MTGVRDGNGPDDLLTWALAELARLDNIAEDDPRHHIAGELIAFWTQRLAQLMDAAADARPDEPPPTEPEGEAG